MSVAYERCDRCGRDVPAEGERAAEGFALCDACLEDLAERAPAHVPPAGGPTEDPAGPWRRPGPPARGGRRRAPAAVRGG